MKKFTWIFGLALLWGGLNAVAQTAKEIWTFTDLQKAGTAFANARTVNSRLAAKNKELEAANKAVQTAEKNLSDAENKLLGLENKKTQAEALVTDLKEVQKPAAYKKWQDEKKTLSGLQDKVTAEKNKLPKLNNALSAQKGLLQDYIDDLTTYNKELETAQKEGVEVKEIFGLTERQTYLKFLDDVDEENENGETIYCNVTTTGKVTFSLTAINSKYFSITPTDYSALTTALTGKQVFTILFYYNYKEYEEGLGNTEKNTTGSGNVSGLTSAEAVFGAFYGIIHNFSGVEKTVKKQDPAAVAAIQRKIKEQEAKIAAQEVVVQNAQDAVDTQNAIIEAAQQAVTAQETKTNEAKAEYDAYDGTDEKPGLIANAEAAVTAVEEEITTAETEKEEAQTALNNANKEVTRIEGEIEEINEDAVKVNDYKHLSIMKSIDVKDANFTLGEWGSDCIIEGNGCVITYPEGADGRLVGINRGAIEWLGVINGKLASSNSGGSRTTAFEATKNSETGELSYNIYSAEGVQTANLPMDGALAYRARPHFGVAITKDKETDVVIYGRLDKKTAANTVYKAEWTDARTKNTTTFYTNATTTDLSYNPAKGKDNTFAYVLDNDLNVTAAFTAKNVVVKGICKNAEFTDDVTEGDNGYIYIPTAFKAEKLSYNRSFSASALATVCLPFEVSEATFKAAGVTNTMQFYELEAATNTYWFKYQEGSMRANEPYILKFGENFAGGTIFAALENINVAATGSIDRFAVAPERPGSGADFLGVFVSTNATQLAQGGYTLYGFGGGKFRPMTISESNKCLPFRTYVRARNTGNAPAEVFNIGELDEDGNIVTDGGETAISTTEAETFSVRGINGALVITTDKAQRVSIYTIGGSLVKATNVEAGSVTVPVAAGMYIVNGKKVFVK